MNDIPPTKPTYPPTELGSKARRNIPDPPLVDQDTAEIEATKTHVATPPQKPMASSWSIATIIVLVLMFAVSIAASVQAYRNFNPTESRGETVPAGAQDHSDQVVEGNENDSDKTKNESSGNGSDDQPEQLTDTYINSIGMEFALIPAGSFLMGSGETREEWKADFPSARRDLSDEKPQHLVKITQPYFLGKHEVTQAQFEAVMQANPAGHSSQGYMAKAVEGIEDTSNFAVENITWGNAAEFCRKLSALPDERKNNIVYRLPTEAEWEYACRAGETGRYAFADDVRFDEFAWNKANSNKLPHPVGKLKPNAWGLYDMHGNVWEWCADYASTKFYAVSPLKDPWNETVNVDGLRVIRGGSYQREQATGEHRSSCRDFYNENLAAGHTGFRVYCETPLLEAYKPIAN